MSCARAPRDGRRARLWHELMITTPANKAHISQWARDYWEELHPTSAGGAYVNFLMNEGQAG